VPAACHLAVETLHVGHALLALFVLTKLDVLLSRVYLPAALSGAYAVGVLMAKVAFFLPQFVTVVMFPRMAQSKDTRPVLLAATATGILGLLITAVTALLSTLVVRILGGPSYLFLAPDMAWFAALGSLYALVQVLLYGRIAVGDRRAVAALWAGAAALLVTVSVWRHDSVEQIVSTALVVAVVLAAAGLVATVRAGRSGSTSTPPLEPAGPATAQG
jgi:O-antigen/teichoic acid export membrane protein